MRGVAKAGVGQGDEGVWAASVRSARTRPPIPFPVSARTFRAFRKDGEG
ncbi:hypothetical protein HMPREF9440_00061 [Sutterella parvirubra YIT 11816]|uniref:Uncharacterized protein n=1 Tax=Sutterella parvirubra YIT 11816 TaxID=762967 RepID=H3KBG6_9BURK|nr:hypothetical protein HMPREF9440_00061 [Sutterella parvirubra YIT 11816]